MSDERAERIADFIEPLRIRPGSTLRQGRDFGPREKAGPKKRYGVALPRSGVKLPAEYQEPEVLRGRCPVAAVPGLLPARVRRDAATTSTQWAPWYVVPADRKWFAPICAAAVPAHTLIGLGPRYPEADDATRQALRTVGRKPEQEAPTGLEAYPYTARHRPAAGGKRHWADHVASTGSG